VKDGSAVQRDAEDARRKSKEFFEDAGKARSGEAIDEADDNRGS
jgi:hypothetical protein